MQSSERLQRVLGLVDQLIQPHPSIQTETGRQRARLLAGVSFASIFATLVWSLVLLVLGQYDLAALELVIALGLGWVYSRSRSASYEIAVHVIILLMQIEVFAITLLEQSNGLSIMILLPVYMASLFFGWRAVALSAGVSIGGYVLIVMRTPGDLTVLFLTLSVLLFGSAVMAVFGALLSHANQQLKQKTDMISRSESRFRAAIDGMTDLFFLLKTVRDHDGSIRDFVVLDVSPDAEAQFGQPRAWFVGRSFRDLLPKEYTDELMPHFVSVVDSGTTLIRELQMATGEVWEYQIVRVEDDIALHTRNISERKQSEQRQVELRIERARVDVLKRFISDAAHDLISPITIIKNGLYLAQRVPEVERKNEYLQRTEAELERLQLMIQDMLTLARLDTLREADLELEMTDVETLLKKLRTRFQQMAINREQSISVEVEPALAGLLVDAERMEMALANLVDNALRHTPDGSRVRLRARQRENEAVIEVEDDGKGITAAEQQAIFERFYKSNKARTPGASGAGLGLAITQRIVEIHGGRVEVESANGSGALFRVVLPMPVTG
ncbi:MAG: PAS domain-containing protein [Anaerolineae bacterium]|nr:PAS domain-containing protein [Anaerolineae bacterium]